MSASNQGRSFPNSLDRRNFMRLSGGCAALSSTSLLSTLVNLKLTNTAVAAGGDLSGYKALVCVFLLGGYDSFNVLTPYEDDEYADYQSARTNLALPKSQLLEIAAQNGRRFGIHEGMAEMQQLYGQGKAAFVANVGSLVEPTTKQNYSQVQKPLGLYSHSDLIQHWQTSVPQSRTQVTGWGGRMADMLTDQVNTHPSIAMNIALGSLNTFETGSNVVPYVVQRGSGATPLWGYPNTGTGLNGMYSRATDSMLGDQYSDLLEKSYSTVRRSSMEAAIDFNAATGSVEMNTEFPQTNFGRDLEMVAKTIGAQSTLGQSRQIFFVSVGGWDHHDEVLNRQAGMLPMVSQALKAFYDATVELGVANDVTTFTASDFGRTLSSNGNGSDHAWGGNHMVMGGSVSGGDIYGDYPETLALNNDLDTGRGRIIPTTAVDQYNAELACWFGVANDSTLEDVLPNIRNFYSAGSSTPPVGFMGGTGGSRSFGPGGGRGSKGPGLVGGSGGNAPKEGRNGQSGGMQPGFGF
ncbi:MAG: DUF1501 domain-containing protein [Aureliella sp.]